MSFNYKSITPLTSNLSKLEKYKEKLKERQIFFLKDLMILEEDLL